MSIEMAIREVLKLAVKEGVKEAMDEIKREPGSLPGRKLTDEMWTVKKAAKVASVSAWMVREWIKLGRVRSYGAGRLLRVRKSEFETFLTRQGTAAGEAVDADRLAEQILARRRARG